MNFSGRGRLRSFLFCGERTFGIQRRDGQVLIDKIFRRDAANIVQRYFLDGSQIIAAEIQVSRQQPVRSEIGRLAAHGGERVEMMTERHFFRFHQFIRGHARLLHFGNDLQDQLLSVVAFFWIDGRVHTEQSRIARCVGKCRDAESETGFFPDAPI